METGFRQEVLNVVLAQILEQHGVISAPETILKARPGMKRRMPDVLVYFRGLRLIIEGEVEDAPKAEENALNSARQRVEEGLAHIGVAVVYPAFLRKIERLDQLKSELEESQLSIAIFNESGETGFTSANIKQLIDKLYQTFDQLVQEDVVKRATAILDEAVEKVAPVFAAIPGFPQEAAKILGIRALPTRKKASTEEEG
ncbi:MAG: hypothetical protein PHU44_11460 [Syntrophales bacterium]|nr:hypothetical protein [Syntrophales bacterium]